MNIDSTFTRYADASDEVLMAALTSLRPNQRAALSALAGGATQTEAAEAAGVTRETVTRWNSHPEFRAAHARLVNALEAESYEKVRMARVKVIDVITARLDAPDVSLADAIAAGRLLGIDLTPPTAAPVPTAVALIDQARENTRFHCPPTPRGRGLDDLLADVSGDADKYEAARIDRLTLTRLADAAGIDPDDLDLTRLADDQADDAA